jgi:hypothetical protein
MELWAAFALPRREADALAQRATALAKALSGPAVLRIEALEVERLSNFPGPLWAAAFRAGGVAPAAAADFALPAPRELCVKTSDGAAWVGDACDRPAPALAAAAAERDSVGSVDLPGLAAALERASPLAALKGQLPAAAYTAKILFGRLLAGSEALGGTAHPSADFAGAADVSLSWTLR